MNKIRLLIKKREKTARTSTKEKPHRHIVNDMSPSSKEDNILVRFQGNLSKIGQAVDEYEGQKKALLKAEDGKSWQKAATDKASPREKRAADIIRNLREYERDEVFGNQPGEAIPPDTSLDMGGQFLTNKGRIEKRSNLFKIAQMLPKGAHHHLHFNAELTPGLLISEAKNIPNMYIRSTQPLLRDEDYEKTEMVFNVLPKDTPSVDIFAENYNPKWRDPGSQPWMLWSSFRERFQTLRKADAEEWIRTKMVISEEEAYGIRQTTNGIWARFNQATRCFKGLLNYESIYRKYIGEAIRSMIEDKVMYAELRPMLLDKSIPSDDGLMKLDHEWQMNAIIEEVKKLQRSLENKEKFPFGLKIIYCSPRSIPKEMMRKEIVDCIKLKLKFPDLICGFDLVGAEDRPNNIGFYAAELLAMQNTCKELNLEIPFMFHAGETLIDAGGDVTRDPTKSNLYDAVLLHAKRIGHGISLLKHPVLIDKFKEENICIELCPTSNELLHLCRNIKEHPFPQLLAAGLQCSVNSDNPSLFSNSVSHEFYQLMVGDPNMSLFGWRQLAEWSITHSCLSDADKNEAFRIYEKEWKDFVEWVIENFDQV